MRALEQFKRLDEAWSHFKGLQSSYYQMGPFNVRISYANATLAKKMTEAFKHLKIAPVTEPDFEICLWDTTKDKKLPLLDWYLICHNGYLGYYEEFVYLQYFEYIGALSFLNTEQNKAFYIVRDVEALPWWVSGSPLQVIIHAWLRNHGMQLTHTAAIGNDKAAVLLCGKGGSGKSTTTLSCLGEGLNYLGEDYCILAPGEQPKVYSIYQSAKWLPQTRKLFPDYENFITNPDTADREKALIFYQDIFPTQIKSNLPIVANISLKLGEQKQPILERYEPRLALKNLMMSTFMQLPLYHPRSMNILKEIAGSLKHYHLTLGQDLKANVSVIQCILSESS